MFADNNLISVRQLKRQMVLGVLGLLLLFQSGRTASGGVSGLLGLIFGTLLLLVYLFLLVGTAEVYGNLERYLGTAGRWAVTAVYLSFLLLSGSVLLEKITQVIQDYLLPSVPQPAAGAAFLAAAFLGVGQDAQRRGRLAELCYPWILGIFLLLLLLAAPHFRGIHPEAAASLHPEAVSAETVRVFGMGTVLSLLPFAVSQVRERENCFRVLRRGIWLLLLITLGTAGILIGVYGWKGVERLEYPVLHLMTGTNLPGGFLGRFDILWLAVLLFALLFSMGSLLFYGGRLCSAGDGDWKVRLFLAAGIWLGSFLRWDKAALSEFYDHLVRDIYTPLFLAIALLAVWAKRRLQNGGKHEENGEAKEQA